MLENAPGLTSAQAWELQLYMHLIRILFWMWAVSLLWHVQHALGSWWNFRRRPKQSDIAILTAGRDLENWVNRSPNRSAAVAVADHGEWCITLRDPDMYLSGVPAVQLYTSPARELADTVQAALQKARDSEAAAVL